MQIQATVGICTVLQWYVLPPSASNTDWPLRLSQTSKPSLEGWESGTPLLQSHGNDRVGTIAALKDYQNSTCNFEGQTLTIQFHYCNITTKKILWNTEKFCCTNQLETPHLYWRKYCLFRLQITMGSISQPFSMHPQNSDGNRTVPSREVPGRSQDGTGQDRT